MESGTVLVTGATQGLGKAIADELRSRGRRVVIVARDRGGTGGLDALIGDLAEMEQARRIALEAASRFPDLDALINNAGVSRFSRELTSDGHERTFATNHMAPFLLSNLLLPTLRRNRGSIVNITSEQHRWVRRIPWDDLQCERRFQPLDQYSLTKLYNVLFTRELARRTAGQELSVSCVSPGFLRTRLARDARGWFRVFISLARPFQKSPARGAKAVVHALETRTPGAYFSGLKLATPSSIARDPDAAGRLWDVSRELAGSRMDPLETAKVG